MNRIIITAGRKYIDIDVYASCIAYRELLNSLGKEAYAVSTAIENESISPIIKELGFEFDDIEIKASDIFSILDISYPEMFDKIVNIDNIVEVIDHHTGYEDYWNDKLGSKAQIEHIGSVATIIFEKYVEHGKEKLLDNRICKLLVAAILDNTLNLKSTVTTDRDINAYNKLLEIGDISKNWYLDYFESCYKDIEKDLEETLKTGVKVEYINDYLPKAIGQLMILDKDIIFDNIDRVKKALKEYPKWMLNLLSLKDGKSYIIASDIEVKERLEDLFEIDGTDNMIILEKFMLRKEIIKFARNK